MDSLYLAFTVVFPLFCMMATGYFLTAIKLFNDDFLTQLNSLCFKVFLPLVLFRNIYKSDFGAVFSVKLIAFSAICVFVAFLLLMLIVPIFEKKDGNRGVIIQGILRSNFILFGIPVSAAIYGADNTSVTAIVLAFIIPLFNFLSIIALETFSGKKSNPWQIIKKVFRNPLIMASVIGFVFMFVGIKLPFIIDDVIADLASIATPLALVILGGSFKFKSLKKDAKQLIFSVMGKLVLMPLAFMPIAILFGFRGMELAAIYCMLASPTAVSSFTMAQNAKANSELAGQIVVVDSLFSVVSIFIGVSILTTFSLI